MTGGAASVAPQVDLPAKTTDDGSFRMNLKNYAIAVLIVATAQTAALSWIIASRISLINSGQEIRLNIVPIDPRSLFRGDYVILNYEISALDTEKLAGDDAFKRNAPIYVTLRRDADGNWMAANLSKKMAAVKDEGKAVIRGKVRSSGKKLRVNYGIESYFVPEGEGKRLENLARDKKLAVLVAIGASGEAAIKGLLIDGELQYEEPLF